ncbi:MAG: DUF5683 domain-containing protein [Chitinophagales bacterium]
MRQVIFFLFLFTGIIFIQTAYGQHQDSLPAIPSDSSGTPVQQRADTLQQAKDSALIKKKHNPRKATIYSAILPGAGQVYNHKYWKVPIVYAAIGIPAYAFFYNKSWYRKCQYALAVTVNGSRGDSLAKVDPQLVPFVTNGDVNSIITNRDSFRKNQDYSVLFFLLFYGLNIVDATVDAHLRDFNVNSDLSFKIKPLLITSPGLVAGVSMIFDIHKARLRPLNMN